MYFKNRYLRYSSNAKTELLKKNDITSNMSHQFSKVITPLIDDFVLNSPLLEGVVVEKQAYKQYEPFIANARHVFLAVVNRFLASKHKVIITAERMGLSYTTPTGKLLTDCFDYLGLKFMDDNLRNAETFFAEGLRQWMWYHYVTKGLEETKVFDILSEVAEESDFSSELNKGYFGEATVYSLNSHVVHRSAALRNNFTIKNLKVTKEELISILKYSLALGVKERNLQSILYVTLISYLVGEQEEE